MAAIETLLRNKLVGTAGVAALVSTRVHPDMLPQNVTYPAIRYVVTDSPPTVTTAGARFLRARIQLDVYAASYASAKAVTAAVRTALNRWTAPADGIVSTVVDDERDVDDSEEQATRVSLDVLLVYRE